MAQKVVVVKAALAPGALCQQRDPIKLFAASLKDRGVLSDAEFQQIEAEVKEQVERAVLLAEQSPLPAPEELFTDVYANPIKPGKQ